MGYEQVYHRGLKDMLTVRLFFMRFIFVLTMDTTLFCEAKNSMTVKANLINVYYSPIGLAVFC